MHAIRPASLMLRIAASFPVFVIALSACATAAPTRSMRIVNATYDDVTALAVAPVGSDDFRELALARPLVGGLGSIMVSMPADTCRHDVRVTFRNGRALRYAGLDVCRHDGLRLATGAQPGRATPLVEDVGLAGSP